MKKIKEMYNTRQNISTPFILTPQGLTDDFAIKALYYKNNLTDNKVWYNFTNSIFFNRFYDFFKNYSLYL
jgi:hypothetical protein